MDRRITHGDGVRLTDAEFDTLCGYAEGLTTEEIAKRMYRATVTVNGYRKSLFRILGVGARHTDYKLYAAIVSAWRSRVLTTCPVCRRKRYDVSTDNAVRKPVQPKRLLKAYPVPESVKVSLTIRRHEVLVLMAKGFENPEIGKELGISVDSVKIHVKHILRAFGARTRTQAVALGFAYGLLTAADVLPKEPDGDLHDEPESTARGA